MSCTKSEEVTMAELIERIGRDGHCSYKLRSFEDDPRVPYKRGMFKFNLVERGHILDIATGSASKGKSEGDHLAAQTTAPPDAEPSE
jgi:hypothetical protein